MSPAVFSFILITLSAFAGLFFYLLQIISRRNGVEQTLRLSEECFLKAFRSSPAWVTLSNLASIIYIDVNDVLREKGFVDEMSELLLKPVSTHELLKQTREILGR
jgi:hypothetical protein